MRRVDNKKGASGDAPLQGVDGEGRAYSAATIFAEVAPSEARRR